MTMTKEDKQLLLQDLCARLPYGVRVKSGRRRKPVTLSLDAITDFYLGCSIKPYLRPMSSMTEEEVNELKNLCSFYIPSDSKTIGFEDYGILVVTHHITNNTHSFKLNIQVIDWLNSYHFDYRGLIEKDLAIEVTEENNPYKE